MTCRPDRSGAQTPTQTEHPVCALSVAASFVFFLTTMLWLAEVAR